MNLENTNTTWANIFVDELARNDIKFACISPGSRSTPLTLAFFNQTKIKVFSHIDERSASFFALGIALSKKTPVYSTRPSRKPGEHRPRRRAIRQIFPLPTGAGRSKTWFPGPPVSQNRCVPHASR